MTAEPLRCAVIGVGRIGSLHAQVLAQDPRVELVGIVDPRHEVAEQVARTLGTRAFSTAKELVSQAHPQAVTIAVPENARLDIATLVARSGAHLLLEKPLTPTLACTDKLVQEVEATGVRAMVNFILRSDERYEAVQEAAASGRLGELRVLSATRSGTSAGAKMLRDSTGLLISTGIHDIDAMTWIAGSRVERVYAEAIFERGSGWGREDAIVLTLRFASGAIGQLDTSWVMPSSVPQPLSARLNIVGTGGSAEIIGSHNGLSIVDSERLTHPDLANWPVGSLGVGGSFGRSVRRFVGAILDGGVFPMSLGQARHAEAVVDAALRSVASGSPEVPSYAAANP